MRRAAGRGAVGIWDDGDVWRRMHNVGVMWALPCDSPSRAEDDVSRLIAAATLITIICRCNGILGICISTSMEY